MTDWTEKYRPKSLDGVIGNPGPVKQLRDWAASWDRGTPVKRAVVLMGSPGIGKTTSAEALAREMGWDIVEMNASDQRTGAEIERIAIKGSMFNTFGDDGMYMDSGRGMRKLIVLDEADSLFGNADRGAMPVINKLIKTSMQPVILIVNDFYELSRKSSAIKTETLQITYKRPSASSIAKALSKIAQSEGVEVEPDAMNIIATNAAGDMRAAVRNLESLALGSTKVTVDMAEGLSRREERKDMYALINAIFHGTSPIESRRLMMDVDAEPSMVELWVDENLPYKYADRGDLVRGYERLSRADIFLGRVSKRQYYGFWSYAGDMMSAGVASARFGSSAPGAPRFPMYLSKMSKSKGIRSIKASTVSKLAVGMHTSTKRIELDVLPMIKSLAAEDEDFRMFLVESMDIQDDEMAFILGIKSDDKRIKALYKAAVERAEDHRMASLRAAASKDVQPTIQMPIPAPVKTEPVEVPAPKPAAKPKSGQCSLFDF